MNLRFHVNNGGNWVLQKRCWNLTWFYFYLTLTAGVSMWWALLSFVDASDCWFYLKWHIQIPHFHLILNHFKLASDTLSNSLNGLLIMTINCEYFHYIFFGNFEPVVIWSCLGNIYVSPQSLPSFWEINISFVNA